MTTQTFDDAEVDIDLRSATEVLALPFRPPVRPADVIVAGELAAAAFRTCPLVIDLDLTMAMDCGLDPNEALLHELVHAWQWFQDPAGFPARTAHELATYGYEDAPHEVEARQRAATMAAAGVRVFFPSPELAAELHDRGIAGYGPDDDWRRDTVTL